LFLISFSTTKLLKKIQVNTNSLEWNLGARKSLNYDEVKVTDTLFNLNAVPTNKIYK